MGKSLRAEKAFRNVRGVGRAQERTPAVPSRAAHRGLMIAGAIVASTLLIGAMAAPLSAQTYPTRPIRLILPFPPGGATDILGRVVGQKLAERLGQPVVPENRPGAGSNIGIELVAKSRPDGYTLVLVMSTLAISPSLYRKLNYDPIKDLAPISMVAQLPSVLLVKPSLPIKNLKELVEYAKAHPGKLNFGSSGVGSPSHLTCELLKILGQIDIVHVPYKGSAQAMMAMMGGEADIVVIAPPAAIPQIEAGKVRALAVLSKERLPSLASVPTSKEAGMENLLMTIWYGLLAPAGMPRDIINRLNEEWIKIAAMPDTRSKFDNAGVETLSSTPEQFAEFIKAETARWAKVVKEAKIPPAD